MEVDSASLFLANRRDTIVIMEGYRENKIIIYTISYKWKIGVYKYCDNESNICAHGEIHSASAEFSTMLCLSMKILLHLQENK